MVELCGAVNTISDTSTRYPQISQEVLLDGDPDVIIAAAMTTMRWTAESLRTKTGWQNLKALREGRLHLLDGDAVSRCGPRLVEVLETMAYAIYPARYPDPNNEKSNTPQQNAELPP
jgi:iron complex transport system substrate-binding protein